jgi:hypothetical protein
MYINILIFLLILILILVIVNIIIISLYNKYANNIKGGNEFYDSISSDFTNYPVLYTEKYSNTLKLIQDNITSANKTKIFEILNSHNWDIEENNTLLDTMLVEVVEAESAAITREYDMAESAAITREYDMAESAAITREYDMAESTAIARESVIEKLDKINKNIPEICLSYAFITPELKQKFKTLIDNGIKTKSAYFMKDDDALAIEYHLFLKNIFRPLSNAGPMETNIMQQTINPELKLNSLNFGNWHVDGGPYGGTHFNSLYYHKLENCEISSSGTDIAYIDESGNIVIINLPIIEDIIILLKDSCFVHKSPIIKLIDTTKDANRTLIQTNTACDSDIDINTQKEIYKTMTNLAERLNNEQIKYCSELLRQPESSIDINDRIYCLNILKMNNYIKNE